jgi:hypothetical protein
MSALRRVFAPVLRRKDIPVNEIAVFRKPDSKPTFELYRRIPLVREGHIASDS